MVPNNNLLRMPSLAARPAIEGRFALKALVVAVGLSLGAQSAPVSAATLTVTSNADSGAGTLRAAIASAASGDTITFSTVMTINLSTLAQNRAGANDDSLLYISKNLTIDGDLDNNGTSDVTLNGQYKGRVLEIASGTTVTLEGLTISNGLLSGDGGHGSTALGNHAGSGGSALGAGILNAGTLTIVKSTVSGHRASGGGGGGIMHKGDLGAYDPFSYGGGGGAGYSGVGGGTGGNAYYHATTYPGDAPTSGAGGAGGNSYGLVNALATSTGKGGTASAGGAGGSWGASVNNNAVSQGGAGGHTSGIGGGGGAPGIATYTVYPAEWWATHGGNGGAGGTAVAGIYNTGTLYIANTTLSNNAAAGGGGAGNDEAGLPGAGGSAAGAISSTGSLNYQSGTVIFSSNGAAGGLPGWDANNGTEVYVGPAATSYADINSTGTNSTTWTPTPAAPSAPDLVTASDSGSSNSDNFTNVTTPVFTGTGITGATVTLFKDLDNDGVVDAGESLGIAMVSGGAWSITASLSSGTYSIRAVQTSAGYTSAASTALSVTIDSAAPTAATGTLSVAEHAANGTAVGTVSATGAASYSLTDSAGGRFAIASGGAVTVANGTLLNYEAATSHNITVRATDAAGNASDTVLTVAITNVNEAPVSAQESYSADFGGTLSVDAARGLLANDSDVEGDPLSAVLASGPAYGTLNLNPDGSFSYTHNGIDSVDDTFSYQASDGSLSSAVTTVSLALRTVSSDPGVLTLSPRVARFAPVTVGSYGNPLLFTLKNSGSSAHTIGAVTFGGPSSSEFYLHGDGCSGQSLGAGASCTIEVSFHPLSTGSKAATLEVATDELDSAVRVAFLTNAEGAAEEAERRLPPVLRSYVLYPEGQPGSPVTTLTSGSSYTLEWVVLGYADSYQANAALFDCRGIVDGSCADQYDSTERFTASGNLTPAEAVDGDWSYGGELARAYTYRYTFTVPAARFDSAGDIVLRFYQKSALDALGDASGISLLVPGGVAARYYDNAGRRIIEEVAMP